MPPPLPSLSLPSSSGRPRPTAASDPHGDEERNLLSTISARSSTDLPASHSKEDLLLRHHGPSPRLRNRLQPLFRRVKDNGWVLFAFVLGCCLGQAGWRWAGEQDASLGKAALGSTLRAGEARVGVWSEYGEEGVVPLGTKVARPEGMPECERTLLFDWAKYPYGFGSTATSLLQAAFFAHVNNYTMLFSRGANGYGAYLDHFSPAPLTCWPREEHYDPAWYQHPEQEDSMHMYHVVQDLQKQVPPRTHINRVIVDTDDLYPLNWYLKNQTYDFGMLSSLPEMSSTVPLSPADNVPTLFSQRFSQFSALANKHFTLNPLLQSRVGQLVRKYGLDQDREVPTVGVHWRGGDKLKSECRPSSKLSCGNITHHCQTALESLTSITHLFPHFDASSASSTSSTKPRMLLMTAEPDALSKFRADEVCQRFQIEELPRKGGDKPFLQQEWKQLPESIRLEDTRMLLSQSDLLANYVDLTVGSANSNSVRIMQVRAGPKRLIDEERFRSVDYYWHPMQFPPYRNKCDGQNGGCYPE